MEKKISTRDTKATILKAYDNAIVKLKEFQTTNPRAIAKVQSNQTAISAASSSDVKDIVSSLADTQVEVNGTFNKLTETIIAKRNELDTVQTAITAEKANLKEIFGIVKEADTLAAIIESQQSEKDTFDFEMAEARDDWKKTISSFESDHVQDVKDLKSEYSRLASQSAYSFSQQKMKENDVWEQEKLSRQRDFNRKLEDTTDELNAREDVLSAAEENFADMKDKFEAFPSELAQAIEEATANGKSKASTSWGFEKRALEQDHKLATSILQQKVESLSDKYATLFADHNSLKERFDKSTDKVESIAKEAIQGAQQKVVYQNGLSK